MTDPRHLREADADDRAALLEENRRLSERVRELETALEREIAAAKERHDLALAALLMAILEAGREP